MGGTVPFGYCAQKRSLVIDAKKAATLRIMFETYALFGTVEALMQHLQGNGIGNDRTNATDPTADGHTEARHTGTEDADAEGCGAEDVGALNNSAFNDQVPQPLGRAALHHMLKNPLCIYIPYNYLEFY